MARDVRLLAWVLLGVLCAICVVEMVRAEEEGSGPGVTSRRLVRLFDFEETIEGAPLGRFERLPLHWYVMGRPDASSDTNFVSQPLHQALMNAPGYSRHGSVGFDTRAKTSGEYSLHLGLDGGSVGAFLQLGTLPAMAGIDYLIQFNVRTGALEHAAAHVKAYFVDARGEVIESSVVDSGPIRTAGEWQTLRLRLIGRHETVAWIGLQLELLQRSRDERSPLGDRQIVYQQVRGDAWFDDIAVWQLPHVELRTSSAVNVIRSPQRPELSFVVRDMTGQMLVATASIYDHERRLVARDIRRIGAGEPTQWKWVPALNRFGWYLVDLQLRAADAPESVAVGDVAGGFAARTILAFLYMDEDRALDAAEAARFGMRAEEVTPDELVLLPELMAQAGVSHAVISAWDRDTTADNLVQRIALLEGVVDRVVSRGGRLTMSLSPMPDALVDQLALKDRSPLSLFASDVSLMDWNAYISALTLRFGQRVRHWQLGGIEDVEAFHRQDLDVASMNALRTFSNLAPQPRLVLPWRMVQSRRVDVDVNVAYALDVPPAVRPGDFVAALEPWQQSPTTSVRLDLRTLPATQLDHAGRISDLVLRMVHGWEAGAAAITLDHPWTLTQDRAVRIAPDPLVGVFSTVAHRLAGRRVVGRLPLGPGLEAMVLQGEEGQGDALVAWNRSAPSEQARLDMDLGGEPYTVDVFNNRQVLPRSQGRHQLALTSTPIFIEGIDARLAIFRARFAVDEPFIPSTQKVHRRQVTIHNPWPRTITGQMRIVEPADWDVQPRLVNFSIAPGESVTTELAIKFPPSETAGPKQLVAAFDFTADVDHHIEAAANLEIGLRDVRVEPHMTLVRDPVTGRIDARVVQIITNTGNEPISLYAFATLPGLPRQERLIPRLQPGQSVMRRFTFTDVADALQQHDVRTGIRQVNGPTVLTYRLQAE